MQSAETASRSLTGALVCRQVRGLSGNDLAIGLLRHVGFANLARARRACDALFNPTTYLDFERLLT